MAKKNEIEQRKKSNDYRKEYEEACLKQLALENRIMRRTLSLCKSFPDVVVPVIKGDEDTPQRGGFGVREFGEGLKKGKGDIQDCLDAMKAIEDHIESLHPHKQGNLFN